MVAVSISILTYLLIAKKIDIDTQVIIALLAVVALVLLSALEVGIIVKTVWDFSLKEQVVINSF